MSSSGLTFSDPGQLLVGGRSQLTWFSTSTKAVILPGETKNQVFRAKATAGLGNHYNEVWASFDEIAYEVYTRPTAEVRVMAVIETCGNDGTTSVSTEVWLGADANQVSDFNVTRGPCP